MSPGLLEKVGLSVSKFKNGDEVFGDIMYTWGGLAEYVAVSEDLLLKKTGRTKF